MTGSWDPASEAGTRCIFFPLGHTPCPYPASPGDTPCPPTVTHGFSTPRGWFENYSRGTSNALRPGCCRAARTRYWQPGILALTEEVSRHEHRATTATLQAASATTPTVHCRSVSGATVTCLSHLPRGRASKLCGNTDGPRQTMARRTASDPTAQRKREAFSRRWTAISNLDLSRGSRNAGWPQLPGHPVIMRANSRDTDNHAAPTQPFCFSRSGRCSINQC